ncbi:MAG: hypothetical protein E6Q97_08135 [Desulfurellales bacterium]|nr:MAG: hypothetical protein E6Q97_08135 [Desulfurellales bacterium]
MVSDLSKITPEQARALIAADLRLLAHNLTTIADTLETTAVEDLPNPRAFAIGFAFGVQESILVGVAALTTWAAAQPSERAS